jgi:hypothetical protein
MQYFSLFLIHKGQPVLIKKIIVTISILLACNHIFPANALASKKEIAQQLQTLADQRDLAALKQLGKKHADTLKTLEGKDFKDQNGPLIKAVKDQDKPLVEALLETGISPDLGYAWYRESPLMLATGQANIPLMKLLLDAGADASANAYHDQPSMGHPVLSYAIDATSLEAVKLLIKAGANVNSQTWYEKFTPLMIAASKGKEDMVNELLKHGADPKLKSTAGKTALQYAMKKPEIAELNKSYSKIIDRLRS